VSGIPIHSGYSRFRQFAPQFVNPFGNPPLLNLVRVFRRSRALTSLLMRIGRLTKFASPAWRAIGHAKHIGIFGAESTLLVRFIGHASQGAADYLFTQKLRAEGTAAEHMGHSISIPTLGQHGNRNHTTYLLAKPAFAAHRIHHFAQKFGIVDFLDIP
jgi:hypothetical protein